MLALVHMLLIYHAHMGLSCQNTRSNWQLQHQVWLIRRL